MVIKCNLYVVSCVFSKKIEAESTLKTVTADFAQNVWENSSQVHQCEAKKVF